MTASGSTHTCWTHGLDVLFSNEGVAAPARNDAASTATFELIDGRADPNGGGLAVLNDDRLPLDADQPRASFFFAQASKGGRVRVDLGEVRDVVQVNSFSWHPGERGPQVYTVYLSDGMSSDFNAAPKRPIDP